LQIGLMGTGYHPNAMVQHDPNLEESFDALAAGGAEFVLTGTVNSSTVLLSPVDFVVLPITTNWTTYDRVDRSRTNSYMYDLKAGRKIHVLEWLLKDLASYDGEDFMGDAAFREKSAVFEPSGKTINKGQLQGKPRYVVKAELKAATVDRLAAHKVALQAMRAL